MSSQFLSIVVRPSPSSSPEQSAPILNHQKLLQRSSLEERAAPNQRLVRVFGIDNAFTTTDQEYYRKFVTDARLKLPTSSDDWRGLAGVVKKDVPRYLNKSEKNSTRINLSTLVQTTVFRAVMHKFFPEHGALSDTEIQSITSLINDLWIASKNETYLESNSLVANKAKLSWTICRIFGSDENEDLDGKRSPLNILLPAYETLWRVVLRLFLEVRYRSTEAQYLQFTRLFEAFLEQPDQFFEDYLFLDTSAGSEGPTKLSRNKNHIWPISVKDIVNEGLRLYPPTRRIHRQVNNKKIAVDVEALHRDHTLWGEDALRFRPDRFVGIKPTATSFLPFGTGVFECPAKRSFGPIMIGVMVAALTVQIGKDYPLRGKGMDEVVDVNVPLGNARNALEELWIKGV